MAATALAVQVAPHAGLLPAAYSTPTQTTGHTAPCGTDFCLVVKVASGGPINVDVHVPGFIDANLPVATPAGAAAPSRRFACATGDNFIPLPADVYADPVTGLATFDLASFATITFACIRTG
jgi:hypothetical protein